MIMAKSSVDSNKNWRNNEKRPARLVFFKKNYLLGGGLKPLSRTAHVSVPRIEDEGVAFVFYLVLCRFQDCDRHEELAFRIPHSSGQSITRLGGGEPIAFAPYDDPLFPGAYFHPSRVVVGEQFVGFWLDPCPPDRINFVVYPYTSLFKRSFRSVEAEMNLFYATV